VPRWQTLLALLAVGAGSVLTAAGPTGLSRLGVLLVDNAGWLLIALGTLALLSAIAPRGALLGPLLLILAGLVVIGWPQPEIWTLSGSVITVGGGLLLIRGTQGRTRNEDRVMRRSGALVRRTILLDHKDICPDHMFLRAVCGKLIVDVTQARPPGGDVLELMITCWGGWVDIRPPEHWAVVSGRLAAANLIVFDGPLDDRQPHPNAARLDGDALDQLKDKRVKQEHRDKGLQAALVVVHVMGLGGGVTVSR
jgi:hypothetical protein